jgi:hypothetical protein
VPGAACPFERRAFLEGGPLGVDGDEAVALWAERCMNCSLISKWLMRGNMRRLAFIVIRRLDIVFGVFEDMLANSSDWSICVERTNYDL